MSASQPILDEEQRQALGHHGCPMLVLAPAGSGKTLLLAERVAEGILTGRHSFADFIAVTFTNKAAAELQERIRQILTDRLHGFMPEHLERAWIGTFHALATRILRNHAHLSGLRSNFRILDDQDAIELATRVLRRHDPDLAATPIELRHSAKRLVERTGNFNTDAEPSFIAELRRLNSIDFHGMVADCVSILSSDDHVRQAWRRRFRAVVVDEYQDIDGMQTDLLRLLIDPAEFVAFADDDQSCYAWRGARPQNTLNFEQLWGPSKIVTLTRNYRATAALVETSSNLIRHNRRRRPKNIVATRSAAGTDIQIHRFRLDTDEAGWLARSIARNLAAGAPPQSIAVLYRTHRVADRLAGELARFGIPFTQLGQTYLHDRPGIRRLLAWLQLASDPLDDLAWERAAASPPFSIPYSTLDALAAHARRIGVPSRCLVSISPDTVLPSDLRRLQALDDAITAHESAIGPAAKLTALLVDPTLAPAWQDCDDGAIEALHERLAGFATIETYLNSASGVRERQDEIDATSVKLCTIHGAKGLQWPTVYLVGWEEGTLPKINRSTTPDDIEEERRLGYIALTRAQNTAVITYCDHRFANYLRPSRFLKEMGLTHDALPTAA